MSIRTFTFYLPKGDITLTGSKVVVLLTFSSMGRVDLYKAMTHRAPTAHFIPNQALVFYRTRVYQMQPQNGQTS